LRHTIKKGKIGIKNAFRRALQKKGKIGIKNKIPKIKKLLN